MSDPPVLRQAGPLGAIFQAFQMSIERIRSDIEIFGWHVVKVLEDENGPGFGYSIGLFQTFSHPEILIVGLRLDLIHLLINNIGADIKKGKIFIEGQFY